MIILPNGDKWIIDDREIKELNYDEARKGNVPITSVDDFVRQLLEMLTTDEHANFVIPRKLTTESGGYWDANFDAVSEVLGALAIAQLRTPMFTAYEMPTGEIHVIYAAADHGGYSVCTKARTFQSQEENKNAVVFPGHRP